MSTYAPLRQQQPINRVQIGLRGIAAVLAVVPLAITASTINSQRPTGIGYPIVLGLSLLSSIITIVLNLVRKRPITPGWHVGVDLILSLLMVILTVLLGLAIALSNALINDIPDNMAYEQREGRNPDSICTPEYASCADMENQLRAGVNLLIAPLVFMIILTLFHVYFFVRACIDVHRARRAAHSARSDAYFAARAPANGSVTYQSVPAPKTTYA